MRSVLRLLASIFLVMLVYSYSPVHRASAELACLQAQPTITGSGTIKGTKGADIIFGSNKRDRIYGGGGDDFICGGGGSDQITGDDGNDVIYGEDGNDEISGGIGNDYLNGGYGDDTVRGDAGNDVLRTAGVGGVRYYDGGEGDDNIMANGTVLGGPGNDPYLYAFETCLGCSDGYADGGGGDDRVIVAGGIAVGGSGNDIMSGVNAGDEVYGDDGADSLAANANYILLDAGPGPDSCETYVLTTITLISCEFLI